MATAVVPPVSLPKILSRPGSGSGAADTNAAAVATGDAHGSVPGNAGLNHFSAHLSFNSARGSGERSNEREKLRTKLIDVGHRFIGFDKVLEEETIKRKNVEGNRLGAVQEGLLKLERAMNSEIKRRVEANKQVQQFTEQLSTEMLENVQSKIVSRVDRLAASVESLSSRCADLEKGVGQFRGELPSKLQVDTAALVKETSELRGQMEEDRQSRMERDTTLLRRIAEIEANEATAFEHRMAALQREMDACQAEVEAFAQLQEGEGGRVEKFHAFVLEEIAGLKSSLAAASQAREQTDDEIVQAMNSYTNALQKGLHAANKR